MYATAVCKKYFGTDTGAFFIFLFIFAAVVCRHVTALKDVIHKAIHDADSATRTEARKYVPCSVTVSCQSLQLRQCW